MKKLSPLVVALALAAPSAAAAAPPNPFGHTCTPRSGVLFCPTANDAQRIPSWDGVPLDVDVTLPATGNGPFPVIVMLHGFGGSKTNFESATAAGDGGTTYLYNNVAYARRGYAVVNYSARGFGRSCGILASRASTACSRGWLHLGDQRYEARDTQHLLGLLVDQRVAEANAIGVTGISYGGGQTQNLARLRDRVRLPGGGFQPWRSPAGTPLEINAAWSRWGWSDLTNALTPNGRFLDFRGFRANQSRNPIGVPKKSYIDGLFLLATLTGYVAPTGTPTADLRGWKAEVDRGEPVRPAGVAVARELSTYHSSIGLDGVTAPLLLQSGWTDDLFPVGESLRVYETFRRSRPARVALQLGDLGHSRGSNKRNADRVFNEQGARFFDSYLKPIGTRPAHNSVTAFLQTCPKGRNATGPIRARSWARLHPGAFRLGGGTRRIRSTAGSESVAKAFDKNLEGDACTTVRSQRSRGTAVYEQRVRRSFTMLGLPTIRATLRTTGRDGLIAGRLWDVFRGRQRLISRGVYRLRTNQRGRVTFQLNGNGWRFARGHRVKLELLGRDPNAYRTSNNRFSVRVSSLVAELPTRERPSRRLGLVKPTLNR